MNSTNSILPGGELIVAFVPGTKGLKAKGKVHGRPAFPDRQSCPKEGELWEVCVSGQNPTNTVWFLKCLRLHQEDSSPQMTSAGTYPHKEPGRKTTESKPANFEALVKKGDWRASARYWIQSGIGGNQGQVELSNLHIAVASRRAISDREASGIVEQMVTTLKEIDGLLPERDGLDKEINGYYAEDFDIAARIYAAGNALQEALAVKEKLRKDDLAYARECSRINRLGDQATTEVRQAAAIRKTELDAQRQILRDSLPALEEELFLSNQAGQYDASFPEEIGWRIDRLRERDEINKAVAELDRKLEELVKAYQGRLAILYSSNQ